MRFPEFEGEWKLTKLGEICKMKAGKFVSASEINENYFNESFPCYGGNGLRGYTKTFNYNGKYSLIGRQGALCGNVTRTTGKFYATEHAVVVTQNEGIESGWMYHFLNFSNLNQYATGMAQPGLSVQNLEGIEAIVPKSNQEQLKISSFLSLIDERIKTQNKIIENLKTLIKATSEKLFTQKLKFKDGIGNDFPGWEKKLGSEVFGNITNKKHRSDLPILAITQEHGAIPRDLIEYQISVTDKSVESYKIVEIGDFIISLRSFQGGIEYSKYKGICSPAYIILRNKIEIDNRFYKYYLKSVSYIRLINKKLEGIRDGKMISYTYFSEIILPFPIVEEQTKIANFLSQIGDKIDIEKQLLTQYENQKKYLLQNLFI